MITAIVIGLGLTRRSGAAKFFVPMHYGTFRLSFEDMDEPPRWLRQLASDQGISHCIRMLEEGVPEVF